MNVKTVDGLDELFAQCPPGGPDDVWKAQYRRDPKGALKALETHPKANEIKKCVDIQLTYDVWSDVFDATGWGGLDPDPFNEHVSMCGLIERRNIFTGQCNDLPDWREPKTVAFQERSVKSK